MRRFLYDTSIFIYALGREHPYKDPCRVQRGIDLFEAYADLDARDAVFAAVALNRGIDAILATDRSFDEIRGLERIDPADERGVAGLVR